MRTEFEFIDHIKKSHGLSRIGDDCAVLPKDDDFDLVITADLLVEDIDFRLKWTTPKFIGHKALAVSLSDIAAMGAAPKWAILSIGVPKQLWKGGFLDDFYEGYMNLAERFNVELVGGDVSQTPGKIVIDSVVGGEVRRGKAILRAGAKPGDKIYVTGRLGGAAGGLKLLKKGIRYSEETSVAKNELILRQLTPWPRIDDARVLADTAVSAMIDISDGVSSDLAHVCKASGVGGHIWADAIPIDKHLEAWNTSIRKRLDLALNGGEDFELLFTADAKKISAENLAGFTCIGEVTANEGIIELIRDGESHELKPKGFQHFS